MNNLFLIGLGLVARWGIYNGRYGHALDDLTPEQAAEVKKSYDDYRHWMRDNGGFLPSLWKEIKDHKNGKE